MYWIAVSQYQDIIRHAVIHDSEDTATKRAGVTAARLVYRAYAERSAALASMLDHMPVIFYSCFEDEVDEVALDGVQATIRGEPARALFVESVNFRDVTEV